MKGDVLTPEGFLEALRDGRRNFDGAIVNGDLIIENQSFDPPFDLAGVQIEGDLTIRFVSGCTINRIRARGRVVIQSVQ